MSLAIVVDTVTSQAGQHGPWKRSSGVAEEIPSFRMVVAFDLWLEHRSHLSVELLDQCSRRSSTVSGQSLPVRRSFTLFVLLQSHSFNLSPEPDFSLKQGSTPLIVYELNNPKRQGTPFLFTCSSKRLSSNVTGEPIVVHRYATGSGVREGGINTVIKLLDTDEMTLVYFEEIPWYFRVFLHTLKITTLDEHRTEIQPSEFERSSLDSMEEERRLQFICPINRAKTVNVRISWSWSFGLVSRF